MKPIHIVGGGIAGLSLGIALRGRGVPVALSEAGTYPRHRVCGEFLSGISEATLRSLGLSPDVLFREAVRARTCAWHDAEGLLLERPLPREAWSLSRHTLDHALATQFAAAGGELRTGTRVAEEPAEGTVWAAGRRREAKASPWVGLKLHVRGLRLDADLEMHSASSGYVGLNRIEADAVNVCGLFLKECVAGAGTASLTETVREAGLASLHRRIAAAEPVPGSFCSVSAFRMGWQASAGDAFALRLGDAAALIAPFTGNGMSMAFEGAALAVGPLAVYAGGGMTWPAAVRRVRRDLHRAFRRRLLFSRLAHPFLLRPFFLRGLAHLGRTRSAVFDFAFEGTRT